jgi:hypothetical protein
MAVVPQRFAKPALCEIYAQFHGPLVVAHRRTGASAQGVQGTQGAAVSAWCRWIKDLVGEGLRRIHIIQMASISSKLAARTGFTLAVFGTSRPGHAVLQIKAGTEYYST